MPEAKSMDFFERYLSLWVLLCIVVGITLGELLGDSIKFISDLEIYSVNIPVAILVWGMIFPMMVQIDFSSLKDLRKQKKGLALTIVVNWLIKPFSMAFFAWIFFSNIFSAFLTPEQADEFIAGAILLGAAPCTAMVFVWSYLTKGDPNYTLVQVSLNDIILLFAFIPLVQLLLGITDISIPYGTLVSSVLIFVAIPLLAGYLTNKTLIKSKGKEWFEKQFLKGLKPLAISSLLLTLVLLFAFQGDKIILQPFIIIMIAVPLTIQTFFIFFFSWYTGKSFLSLPCNINAPAGLIGASNFFELAVAVAISLFGLNSGASLTTVVGVLIEVPIMLMLVRFANRNRY